MCAFGLATLAASAFFVLVGILPAGNGVEETGAEAFWNLASIIFLMGLTVAAFSSTLLLVPVFCLALMSEYFGWNGLLFHGAAGALLGASATGLWQFGRSADGETHLVLVGAAAGIIGASIYWLIAGRNAGKLFERVLEQREFK